VHRDNFGGNGIERVCHRPRPVGSAAATVLLMFLGRLS
jgi:hypothetical protein